MKKKEKEDEDKSETPSSNATPDQSATSSPTPESDSKEKEKEKEGSPDKTDSEQTVKTEVNQTELPKKRVKSFDVSVETVIQENFKIKGKV